MRFWRTASKRRRASWVLGTKPMNEGTSGAWGERVIGARGAREVWGV
jgi:hypothetical protein